MIVLIVDDDLAVLDTMEDIFANQGISIIRAENGEEALEKWKTDKPNIIFTDFRMDRKNGVELTREVRIEDQSIPIIMVTGYPETRNEAIKAGISGFLEKPFPTADILAAVEIGVRKPQT